MMELNTGIFDPATRTFTVKTEKGIFEGVPCVGAYDNYREMDMEVGKLFQKELKTTGVLAYLHGAPETQYLFYYPENIGGDVTITRTA